MADSNTRQAKRTPVTLKIKFKSATLDQFIERYSVDVSHGGIFIRTKDPLPVGTQLRFEFQLKDASPLITGEGTVVWTREHDPARAGVAPGMGVRFDRLADGSQAVLDKILQQKVAKGGRTTGKNEFTNEGTTRVAPSPLMQGLARESAAAPTIGSMAPPRSSFGDERTDATPLPQPIPFHSDADDFPEEAFEEATKVASLDELVARSAREDAAEDEDVVFRSSPRPDSEADAAAVLKDELAERRARREAEVPPAEADADAAPVSAPAVAPAVAVDDGDDDDDDTRELEAARAEVATPAVAKKSAASEAPSKVEKRAELSEDTAARKAARSAKPAAARDDETDTRVATAHATDEPAGSSVTSLLAVAVLLIIVAGGGYWYFVMNRGHEETVAAAPQPAEPAPVEQATPPEPEPAVAPPEPEPVPTFAAEIKSEPAGAIARVVGGDQEGATPHTFELAEGEEHQIEVKAPGYLAKTLTVKQGDTSKPIAVKLAPMKRVLRITSTPPGAAVYVDGRNSGKTPLDLELQGRLANKDRFAVSLRLKGYEKLDLTASGKEGFVEEGELMVQAVGGELEERVVAVAPKPEPPKGEPTRTNPNRSPATGPTQPDPNGAKTETQPARPDGKTDTKTDGVKATAPATKLETKSDPKPKTDNVEPKPDKSDTAKTDVKPDPKPDTKTEPKPVKDEPKDTGSAGPTPDWLN